MLPDTERYNLDTNMDIIKINEINDSIDLKHLIADLIALSEPLKPLCDEKAVLVYALFAV